MPSLFRTLFVDESSKLVFTVQVTGFGSLDILVVWESCPWSKIHWNQKLIIEFIRKGDMEKSNEKKIFSIDNQSCN